MTIEAPPSDSPHRPIRSFVLRQGRITQAQTRAMRDLAPQFELAKTSESIDLLGAFGNPREVILEIGFGNGQALIECANVDPQRNYIGAEVHPPGVGQALLGIEMHQLSNVRIWNDDAVLLLAKLATATLDEIRIWFPDPWHKSRHNKRRLIQPALVRTLADRLKPGGLLHLATDWQPYAEHMLDVLHSCPDLTNTGTDYVEKPGWRPQTHFERRGTALGHGVWDLLFSRNI
jgi:tRNA (guanine-N7-)-methyltransferase